LDWLDNEVSDPSKYPLDGDQPHPPNFVQKHVKVAFKRLFRVYAHIYHSHFQQFVQLDAQAHLNTCFKHFIYFVREFDLVDEKQLEPLKMLIASFEKDQPAY
jgi:MOB kinase activator 1